MCTYFVYFTIWTNRWEKNSITRLNTADYFRKSRKDAIKEQVYFPRELTLATAVCYCNDAYLWSTLEATNLQDHKKILIILCSWMVLKYLQKMENILETLI